MQFFPGKCTACGFFINVQANEDFTKCPYCGSMSSSDNVLNEFDKAMVKGQYHLKTEVQWRGTVLNYLSSILDKVNKAANDFESSDEADRKADDETYDESEFDSEEIDEVECENEEFDEYEYDGEITDESECDSEGIDKVECENEEFDEYEYECDDEEADFRIRFNEDEGTFVCTRELEKGEILEVYEFSVNSYKDDYVYSSYNENEKYGLNSSENEFLDDLLDFNDPVQALAFRAAVEADKMTPKPYQMEAFALHGYIWNKKNRYFEKGDVHFELRNITGMLEYELTAEQLDELQLFLALCPIDEISRTEPDDCRTSNGRFIVHIDNPSQYTEEQLDEIRNKKIADYKKGLWEKIDPEELAEIYLNYYGKHFAVGHKYRVSIRKTKNPDDFRFTGFFDEFPVDLSGLAEDTEVEPIIDGSVPVITTDMIVSVRNVTVLTINGEVNEISEDAFAEADRLERIYIYGRLGNLDKISDNTFINNPKIINFN